MCEILLNFLQKLGGEILFNIMCVLVGFAGAYVFLLFQAPKILDRVYHEKTKAILENYENRVNEAAASLEKFKKNIQGFYDLRNDYERIAGENAELHRRLRKARKRLSKAGISGG